MVTSLRPAASARYFAAKRAATPPPDSVLSNLVGKAAKVEMSSLRLASLTAAVNLLTRASAWARGSSGVGAAPGALTVNSGLSLVKTPQARPSLWSFAAKASTCSGLTRITAKRAGVRCKTSPKACSESALRRFTMFTTNKSAKSATTASG